MKKFLRVKKSGEISGRRFVRVEDITEVVHSKWGTQLYLAGHREPMCLDDELHGPGGSEDLAALLREHTFNPDGIPTIGEKKFEEVGDVQF